MEKVTYPAANIQHLPCFQASCGDFVFLFQIDAFNAFIQLGNEPFFIFLMTVVCLRLVVLPNFFLVGSRFGIKQTAVFAFIDLEVFFGQEFIFQPKMYL